MWISATSESRPDAPLMYAIPSENGEAKNVPVMLEICPGPCCDCQEVLLAIDYSETTKLSQYRVKVNLKTKDVSDKKSVEPGSLPSTLIKSMTAEDWQFLSSCYQYCKVTHTEQADPNDIEPAFSIPDVMSGTLIAYREVLPYQPAILIALNGLTLDVDDMYCVKPSCKCNQVNLLIQPVKGAEHDEGVFITVKLSSGHYEIREPGRLGIQTDALMKKVLTKGNLALFSQRYIRMLGFRVLHTRTFVKLI